MPPLRLIAIIYIWQVYCAQGDNFRSSNLLHVVFAPRVAVTAIPTPPPSCPFTAAYQSHDLIGVGFKNKISTDLL